MLSEKKPKEPQSAASILQNFFPPPASLDNADAEENDDDEIETIYVEDVEEQDAEGDELLASDTIQRGAFELNFAEFPIAHLTQRPPAGTNKHEIMYTDTIAGRDGKPIERKWTIASSAKHGLGGPSSVSVIFEILQLWKEQAFEKPKIYIGSYYNLLKRLGWSVNGRNYTQLKRDLESLYGLEIKAENAFFDTEKNKYIDYTYKPFIGWGIYKAHERSEDVEDYGFIEVNPTFHETFKKKSQYYVPFDSSTFHSLTAHEQKLSLYLSKIFNPYRKKVMSSYKRNIYKFCDILPILASSKEKQKFYLLKAVQGLIKKKFLLLESFSLEGENIVLYNRLQMSLFPQLNTDLGKNSVGVNYLVDEIMKLCKDEKSRTFYEIVAKCVPDEIIYGCLSEAKCDAKDRKKLFTHLIMEKGKKYLEPVLKKGKS